MPEGRHGALFRRSELVGIDVEHAKEAPVGMTVFVPRSKTDQRGHGAGVEISYCNNLETCPVLALRDWLAASGIRVGPVFRKVDHWGNVCPSRLSNDGVRQIVMRLGKAANAIVPEGDHLSAHGLRAGFMTEAYRAGVGDEEIMAHTRHSTLRGMRTYVRQNRLDRVEMSKAVGL